MPLVRRAIDLLPDLGGVRLACSMHLDIKMAPFVEGVLEQGAAVYLTTCNPETVRDDVVAYLRERGAEGQPRLGISDSEREHELAKALAWAPTHLCEMGADLSVALHEPGAPAHGVQASLEATGTGIARLAGRKLAYPVFNWDDIPVKEGLHNRHMVGLTTWHAFFATTRLTLHGKRVLVVGYGLVGRGLADSARAYGGAVTVAEVDPARRLEAQYAGYAVASLREAAESADVIVTATGVSGLVDRDVIERLPDGAFVLNASHINDEIDVAALRREGSEPVLPHLEACRVNGRSLYLVAGGAMANLVAGGGDSINSFQVTLAVMTAGVAHIVSDGTHWPAGLHPLPSRVWKPAIERP
jgi:adenosylhomocysteinase